RDRQVVRMPLGTRMLRRRATASLHGSLTLLLALAMLTANLPAAFGQSTPRSTVVGDGADPGDVEFVREAIALGKEAVETFSDGPITRQLSVVVRSGVSDRSTTFGLYDDDMIQI